MCYIKQQMFVLCKGFRFSHLLLLSLIVVTILHQKLCHMQKNTIVLVEKLHNPQVMIRMGTVNIHSGQFLHFKTRESFMYLITYTHGSYEIKVYV